MNFPPLNFTEILILLLICLLFAKEQLISWFNRMFGSKAEPTGNGIVSKIDKLAQHYNHETTHLLTEILQELKFVRRDQSDQGRKLEMIISKVEEIIKYGVKELK